ncbi:hypothetical protein KAR91_16560 [Candidatus Pacearchaeota archaeon]|nr:hypothetical protein [Candidatus Pacearchaeota archaeon]
MSRNLDRDKLDGGLRLLDYERKMLRDTAKHFYPKTAGTCSYNSTDYDSYPTVPWDSKFLTNVILESFLVHTRAIIDFLYLDKSKYDDDIFAADYFSDPDEWNKLRGTKTSLLEETKERANKMIAHISLFRLTVKPEEKGWPVGEIVREIDCLLKLFDENRTAADPHVT